MELTIADGSVFVVLPAAEGAALSGAAAFGSWWEAALSNASLRAVSATERTYTLTARSFSVEASGPAAEAKTEASRSAHASGSAADASRPLSLLSTISEASGRHSALPAGREERNALEICVVVPSPELSASDCRGVALNASSPLSPTRGLPNGAAMGPTVSLMLEGVLYDNQLRGPPLEQAVAQAAAFLAPPRGVAQPNGGSRSSCAAFTEPDPPPVLPWRLYVHVRDSLVQHTPSDALAWGETAPAPSSAAAPYAWVLLTGLTLDARFGLSPSAAVLPHEAAAGATTLELMTHTAELFLGREAALRPALPVSAGPGATPLFVSVPPATIDILGTGVRPAPANGSRGAAGADGTATLLLALRAQLHRSCAVRVASVSRLVVRWRSFGNLATSETSISNDEVHLETATDTTDALLRLAPDLGWNIAQPEGESTDAECPPLLPLVSHNVEARAAIGFDAAEAFNPGGGWGVRLPSDREIAAPRRSEPPIHTFMLTPAPLVSSAGHHTLLSGSAGAAGQQAPWLDFGASWPPPAPSSTLAETDSEPLNKFKLDPPDLRVPPSVPRAAFFGGGLHIIDEYSGAHAANGPAPASAPPPLTASSNDGNQSPSRESNPARKARHVYPHAASSAPRASPYLPAERDAFDMLPAGVLGIEPRMYTTSLPIGVGGAGMGPNRPPLEVLAAPIGATCAALAAATEFEEEMLGLGAPGAVSAWGGTYPVTEDSPPFSRSLVAESVAAVVPTAPASAPSVCGSLGPLSAAALEPAPSAFGAVAPARGSARWLGDGQPPVINEGYVPLWLPKASGAAEQDTRGGVRRASQRLTFDEVNVRWTMRVGSGWDAGAGAAGGGGAGALGRGGERGEAPPCMELIGTALSCEYDIFEAGERESTVAHGEHTGGWAAGGQARVESLEWRVRVTLGRLELVDALDPHAHQPGGAPLHFLSPDDDSPRPKEHTAFLAVAVSQCDGETRLRARLQPVRLRVSHVSLGFAMQFAQAAAASAAAADQRATALAAAAAPGRLPPPITAEPSRLVIELCDVRPLYLRIDFLVTLSSLTSLYRTFNSAQGPTTKQLINLIPVSDVCLTLGEPRAPAIAQNCACARTPLRRVLAVAFSLHTLRATPVSLCLPEFLRLSQPVLLEPPGLSFRALPMAPSIPARPSPASISPMLTLLSPPPYPLRPGRPRLRGLTSWEALFTLTQLCLS
jgi:hypothetical protein